MPWIKIDTGKNGTFWYRGRTPESAYAAFERDNPNIPMPTILNVEEISSSQVPARYRRMAGEDVGEEEEGAERREEEEEEEEEEREEEEKEEEEHEAPSKEEVLEDTLDTAQDLVNQYIEKQEAAIEAVGGPFEELWDEEAARETAIKKFSEYFEEEKEQIVEDVEEGRIQTVEDYEYALQQVEDYVAERSKEIDITEAETQEELDDRLADIGATTSFNLEKAKTNWKEKEFAERKKLGETGQIYGGRGRERIQDLRQRRQAEIGEITRRGGVKKQRAERSAKYSMQRAAAARQAMEAREQRELGRAETEARRGIRQYGYEEGLVPEELAPEEEIPELGRYGERKSRRLKQRRERRLLAEVNRMRKQKRKEYEKALEAHGYSKYTPEEYRAQILSAL